ncbi:MAG: ring-cleaving dioxygenase [Fimbriimonadaceae bacterium]
MTDRIQGIHHVTAMCSDAQSNVNFYSGVLGLRLVKVTINYDDPSTYHLYYGDPQGSPGTLLTFFPWPQSPLGTIGAGQATTMSFAIPKNAIPSWTDRLSNNNIPFNQVEKFGNPTLQFLDHDGFQLELVASIQTPKPEVAWDSTPAGVAIHGFHGVQIASLRPQNTQKLLTETMGYVLTAEENNIELYTSPAEIGNTVELSLNSTPTGRMGSGIVHHVAFRAEDDEDHAQWREKFINAGMRPTEFIDRNYFHSIYFREPGGILYEIATDPPGMTYNEPIESLGTTLVLPPWLEPHRAEVASNLPEFTSLTGAKFPN